MRPILCLAGTILLLAGIRAYTDFASRVKAVAAPMQLHDASGVFSAEVTCTFDCAASDRFDLPSVEIRIADNVVLARLEHLPRLEKLLVGRLPNVVQGRNEIIVQVHVADVPGDQLHSAQEAGCLRIQVFKDGTPIAEKTHWSEPGQPVVIGALMFAADSRLNSESP